MHAFLHNGSIDELLAKALINNREGSGDPPLLASEILQHLAAMGAWAWHCFFILWHLLRTTYAWPSRLML